MRLLSAAAVAAAFVGAAVMLSAPAFAQLSSSGGEDKALTRRTDAEKKRDAEIDREYRATLRRSGQKMRTVCPSSTSRQAVARQSSR